MASGARPVTTPQFLRSGSAAGEVSDTAPLRTLIDAGVRPIGGTDMTGIVPDGAAPLYSIACAVDRPGPEAIRAEEALRCFTTWAAEGGSEENLKGRLAPDHLGDVAVLCDDLLAVPPTQLFDVEVDATAAARDVTSPWLASCARCAPPAPTVGGGSMELVGAVHRVSAHDPLRA